MFKAFGSPHLSTDLGQSRELKNVDSECGREVTRTSDQPVNTTQSSFWMTVQDLINSTLPIRWEPLSLFHRTLTQLVSKLS